MSAHIDTRWKAIPNDAIGGWCVVPESETRTPVEDATTLADFTTQEIAEHVAEAHNDWLLWYGPRTPCEYGRCPSCQDPL